MLLSEILEQLTIGEISQLSMGGPNTNGIQPQDYPKVIPHINLGGSGSTLNHLGKNLTIPNRKPIP